MSQKIRILLVKKGNISEAELSRRMGTSSANLHQKMKRDNLTENELRKIAAVMGCSVEINFIDNETGERT
ncbi:MAG: helix-turn-helix transcriptional regulator [Treponema sp.]|jgi:DNA-binding Xre family transcriptional regulator|nr:helix-turn-helix transcriptional regulator [Treponema sp.]